mmetsp:Transcript_11264/g.31258  ORF Transcript_11264/g.31258 Transcript_11264/m.31258 type:complete len:95 (-) Transcript_11264:9-293(-)
MWVPGTSFNYQFFDLAEGPCKLLELRNADRGNTEATLRHRFEVGSSFQIKVTVSRFCVFCVGVPRPFFKDHLTAMGETCSVRRFVALLSFLQIL